MTLYVDLLLPMVAAAGMLLALSSIRDPRRAALLALPFSVYAYLVKNSGILFSLLISLLLAGIALWNRRQGRPPARRGWRVHPGGLRGPRRRAVHMEPAYDHGV